MRRVTPGIAWMSRAVCVMIRAGGRIVGEGIVTQDRACTIHEHCRSHVLDRMKFLLMSQNGNQFLRQMLRGVITRWRMMLAGRWLSGLGLQPDGDWALVVNAGRVDVAGLHTLLLWRLSMLLRVGGRERKRRGWRFRSGVGSSEVCG